jgi:hypothetical protein
VRRYRGRDPDLDLKGTHVSDSWPPQQPDEPGAAPSGEGASAQPAGPPPGTSSPHGPPASSPQGETPAGPPGTYAGSPAGQPPTGQPQFGAPAAPDQPQYGQPPPPPPGDEPTTPYGAPPYAGSWGQTPQGAYPQQELLPHDVKPSRSRVPLVIGLIVALALVGGGIAAWLLLRDSGESSRAEYCTTVKKETQGGDLTTTLQGGLQAALAEFRTLSSLAPDAVAGDWKTLTNFVESAQKSKSTPSITDALSAFGALKSIVSDSNAHCGTTFKVPSLP